MGTYKRARYQYGFKVPMYTSIYAYIYIYIGNIKLHLLIRKNYKIRNLSITENLSSFSMWLLRRNKLGNNHAFSDTSKINGQY
jgi:hypothetical protein